MLLRKKWMLAVSAFTGAIISAGSAMAGVTPTPTGVPMAGGDMCAVQFFEQDGFGPVLAKVPARFRGRYELRVLRPNPTGAAFIDTAGEIRPVGGREQVVLRTVMNYHDAVSRDGMLFAPPNRRDVYRAGQFRAEFNVYDQRGRLVCRETSVDVYPYARWNDAAAYVVTTAPTPAPYYRDRASRQQQAAEAQARQAEQEEALERQYGIRYRAPTSRSSGARMHRFRY